MDHFHWYLKGYFEKKIISCEEIKIKPKHRNHIHGPANVSKTILFSSSVKAHETNVLSLMMETV